MNRFYPTPEDKRSMAASLMGWMPEQAAEWLAAAAAQESGTTDEYKAALKTWEANKPSYLDFVPADVRADIEALRDKSAENLRCDIDD